MADKKPMAVKKPNTFKGAVVALSTGGPIGNKMRRAGDVFMVGEREFSENWMRKATKEEIAAMKPEEKSKATYDNGTVDRLTGELKAMTEERDKALGELADCQIKLDEAMAPSEAGKSPGAPASMLGDATSKPDGGDSGPAK